VYPRPMRRLPLALVLAAAVALASLATTAAAASFSGAWTKTVTSGPTQLKGRWVLQAAGGKFWITKGLSSTHLVNGTVTQSGSTVTFTDKSGPLSCKGASAVGRYTRSAASGGIKLAAVHDTCAGRKLIMTTGPWFVARG
jgi:hypothetical protein